MKKSFRISAIILCIMILFGGIVSSAASFYTYTYDIDGNPQQSPEIYRPYKQINSEFMGLTTAIKDPTDIVVDGEGKVYIADPTNNRIIVLSKYWKVLHIITSFRNEHGNMDAILGAKGLYVCKDGEIYVADTGNARVVVFDKEYNFLRSYKAPESDVFEEDSMYNPVAIAVDDSKRMYVVSDQTHEGVISLNSDGSFAKFIGAQKVIVSPFVQLWRKFMTAEQRAQIEDVLSTPYNNITIDEKGFIYVTIELTDEYASSQQAAIQSNTSDFASVKKLNAAGVDIMRRNGFFGPSGEVATSSKLTTTYEGVPTGPSSIVDVALGEQETWSIVDQKRSHIFTYDKNGNLLGVFGDKGTQLGNIMRAEGLAYQDLAEEDLHYLLALDGETNTIVIYERTEYGEILLTALQHTNERKYSEAANDWQSILQRNNNYDAAYVGIGDSLYRESKWEEAMEYYKSASDIENYSNTFKQLRTEIVSRPGTLLIVVVVVVAAIVAIAYFFKYAGKKNKATSLKVGKKNFWEEFIYAFHLMFHPFDAYWDLKHEKRGSVRAACAWIVLTIAAFTYQSVGQAYIFSNGVEVVNVLGQIVSILVPLILFITANWCLTTLFEGEGSFKDVFIASGYALSPMPFLIIISTLLTNVASQSEGTFISLINGIAWVWCILLLFFGVMVTHDFSMGKNIITILATIIVMAVIMFVMILFSGLVIKMVSFVSNIITEITYNM